MVIIISIPMCEKITPQQSSQVADWLQVNGVNRGVVK